ncbi:MAG: hypothetical protein CMK56_02920 [Proteobacteria bacterium]|nr:hypothetical protein [Pseudomonadota bacterium]
MFFTDIMEKGYLAILIKKLYTVPVLFCLNLSFAGLCLAETDGEEFLKVLMNPESRPLAKAHIDDVWEKWDGTLFCIVPDDPKLKSALAMDAVQKYLTNNSSELFRPRRYLIIQALRKSFQCNLSGE